MRAVVVWTLGTVYVLAALAGMAAIVWAADNRDNSANPTHWLLSAVVVLAPTALFGALQSKALWSARRVEDRRAWITIGVAVAALLVFGAQEVVADASSCTDDDCARIAIPLAIAIVLGAWTLPLGLLMLRRGRYPAPLLSAGLVAASITSTAALAAAVQATKQEDNYADLTLAVIVMVWMLPAVLALLAMTAQRPQMGTAEHRSAAARTAAGFMVTVGAWFVAMPFAAGVDSDALPIMLVVVAVPGVVLLAVGLWLSFTARGGAREAVATRRRA